MDRVRVTPASIARCVGAVGAVGETGRTIVCPISATGTDRSSASGACWQPRTTKPGVIVADRDHINAGSFPRRGEVQSDQLGTIMITHPSHPLVGRVVPVVRRYRLRGERQWVIALPEGHRQFVPASWCTSLAPTSGRPSMPAD